MLSTETEYFWKFLDRHRVQNSFSVSFQVGIYLFINCKKCFFQYTFIYLRAKTWVRDDGAYIFRTTHNHIFSYTHWHTFTHWKTAFILLHMYSWDFFMECEPFFIKCEKCSITATKYFTTCQNRFDCLRWSEKVFYLSKVSYTENSTAIH